MYYVIVYVGTASAEAIPWSLQKEEYGSTTER